MNLSPKSRIRLNNQVEIPLIGLGTYTLKGKDVHTAVDAALEAGYRLIDTAEAYGNEAEIGEALL